MNTRISMVAGLLSAVLLSACNSDSTSDDADLDGVQGDRRLRTLGSSDAFLSAVREGLVAQNAYYYAHTDGSVDIVGEAEGADGATTDDSADSSDSVNEVTSTNVQEQGVDEKDWVKVSSNGSRLYVLDSRYGHYYGVDDTLIDSEFWPIETPDFTSNEPSTTLRILQLDADTPDASSLNDVSLSLDGRYADGFYLYEHDGEAQAILSASGNDFWGYWSEPAMFGGRTSLVTRVDVTDAANSSVSGTLNVDGQIISSRRIGQHLFLATRFYPQIPDAEPYQVSAEQWQEAVNNVSDDSLLPQYSLDGDVTRSALIDPGNCFVSESANNDSYYSPDIITLSVFDLETWQFSDSECYLGATETLYASPQGVYLATTQYDYSSSGPVAEEDQAIEFTDDELSEDIMEWQDPRVDTDIHQFDIDSGQLVYVGSGTVQGHLGWNPLRKPFRMSEKDGYLRVATMNDEQGENHSPILLSVLQPDGNGKLTNVASLPNESEPAFIGKPGEQLYASRFLGNKAYLVTFRQTDPLYIIDLEDPRAPFIAGELQIDGYSDYLHPIGEDYLLGLGMDAVASSESGGRGDDGNGALVQGLKLSLFNVSNPAAPAEVQSLLVGQRGTESRALGDHRAISVQSATDDHPARVSFGIDVNGQAFPGSSPTVGEASNYFDWSYSGLHGFEVRTGADAGITSRGAMVVESAADSSEYYRSYEDDRAVMVNDSVFYIRGNKVYAAPWDDLANPTPAR